MSVPSSLVESSLPTLAARRARVDEIRRHARRVYDGGASCLQVPVDISESTDRFLVECLARAAETLDRSQQAEVAAGACLVAVGGTGRRELAPFSDADLLFLYHPAVRPSFTECAAEVVRNLWDAGIALGHNVCTESESISLARKEPQIATTFCEARLLWGAQPLFDRWRRKVVRRVVKQRLHAFVDACIAARGEERAQFGSTVRQLEPDVKRSPGGLRDLHLMRWIGFAHYGTPDIDSLRLKGALSRADARALLAAQEFLLRTRIDLHFAASRAQEILTRDEQLRIAEQLGIEPKLGQRPVEQYMQQYFRHSTAVAETTRRFIALHQSRSWISAAVRAFLTHRAEGIYVVGGGQIDVVRRHVDHVVSSLEQILRLYCTAARYGVNLSPELVDRIAQSECELEGELSQESARLFLDILKGGGHLGPTFRSLYHTGILELVVPNMAHARGLLQFNQYHSYTVDEHTMRAVEAAERLRFDTGRAGKAYRAIRHKEILHLAILLHDLGKGFDEDHSDVGRLIAQAMAERLRLPDHHRDTLVFLVHKHLKMAHLAFRRDTSDPETLLEFSREVGSPETLRMLFALTCADITAVGPGVWTDWKSELLTELFDRTMLILSGKNPWLDEAEQLQRIQHEVCREMQTAASESAGDVMQEWIRGQLESLPPHYWGTTPPERIAADLAVLGGLPPGGVVADGAYDAETGTVEYRIITNEQTVTGCFHKTAGVLTASRLEILSAQICTSRHGVVIDSFRVTDRDYSGPIPQERIAEICRAIQAVLTGQAGVEPLFQKNRRFGADRNSKPISDLPTRVVLDNDSSEHCTVIDVFAHDRPGLLYTITRVIHELQLSVVLAKIATHLDQIVDVFYVTDVHGAKLSDGQRMRSIQSTLMEKIEEFERQGHAQFVS